MLPNDITVNATGYIGTAGDKVYNLVSLDNTAGVGTLRRVASTATTTPETLRISHRKVKKGNVVSDQHLARFDEVAIDPVFGSVVSSFWFSATVPTGTTVVTATQIKTLAGRMIDLLLETGYFDKILNGES